MSTELQMVDKNDLSFWTDKTKLKEVKELFAPNLTELEFAGFVGMGKALSLNPFTKDLWAVKYDKTKPAQIFIGRDGYRKAAQRQAEYDYHYAEAIYSNDEFTVMNGIIEHKYNFMKRGELVGAYCVVKRRSSTRSVYSIVRIEEYDKRQSNWNTMKETMIKKVAESQALRSAFQDVFGGTYSEFELPEAAPQQTQTEKLKEKLNVKETITSEGEIIEVEAETNVNIDQLTAIRDLMKEKEFNDERKQKALAYFKVDDLTQLTQAQAEIFITQLEKV